MDDITLEQAAAAVAAARKKAEQIGAKMNIAVVDAGAVIGAIGVSGSTVENDHAVAEAGAATVK
jgi:uncharacterized protein GlcG (DUF336 family)